jgi:hypothetical protein
VRPHRCGGKRSRISSSAAAAAAVCLIFDAIMFFKGFKLEKLKLSKHARGYKNKCMRETFSRIEKV